MKKKILFVDDEEMVLDGLKRMLRPYRSEWDMAFVDSGHKALDLLSQSEFDVIVADMRMPEMNGATLLNTVMKKYPRIVRLILSGHSDNEMIFEAMGATHQYLAKPCKPEVLQSVIRRALAARESLHNEELLRMVGRMRSLPSLPMLYHEIMAKLQNPDIKLEDITSTIARDIGMTAKILQLVNSAFFGLPNHVTDLNAAVSFLGLNVITSLFLTVHAFCACDNIGIPGFDADKLWKHSLATALLSKKICKCEKMDRTTANEAFVAGMLHDAGCVILAANFPHPYEHVFSLAKREKCSISEAERIVFHHSHSTVGGYLMSLWGLPMTIVEAVSFHHDPSRTPAQVFCPLTAVHAANCLVAPEEGRLEGIISQPLDLDYLASLNLTDRIPLWRGLTEKSCSDFREAGKDD